MSHLIETVYNLLWGDLFTLPVGGGIGISLMAVLLLTAGVFFTLRTRLLPVRLFRDMIAAVCEKNQSRDSLSSFQTLIVSTATRVGMGNLVGVVAAVSAGGAGAVFWMWVTALLGASTSFVESTLAQKYRQPDPLYGGQRGGVVYSPEIRGAICRPAGDKKQNARRKRFFVFYPLLHNFPQSSDEKIISPVRFLSMSFAFVVEFIGIM